MGSGVDLAEGESEGSSVEGGGGGEEARGRGVAVKDDEEDDDEGAGCDRGEAEKEGVICRTAEGEPKPPGLAVSPWSGVVQFAGSGFG